MICLLIYLFNTVFTLICIWKFVYENICVWKSQILKFWLLLLSHETPTVDYYINEWDEPWKTNFYRQMIFLDYPKIWGRITFENFLNSFVLSVAVPLKLIFSLRFSLKTKWPQLTKFSDWLPYIFWGPIKRRKWAVLI